jgi:hypothetical protein
VFLRVYIILLYRIIGNERKSLFWNDEMPNIPHVVIVIFVSVLGVIPTMFAGDVGAVLQKHFAVYRDNVGELEILEGDNEKDIDGVLKRTAEKCDAVRNTLDGNHCVFIEQDIFVLCAAEYYCTVERAKAKRALQNAQIDSAIRALCYTLHLAECLCKADAALQAPPRTATIYDARLAAAKLRIQTVPVIKDALLHPAMTEKHYTVLHELLRRQLDRWTKDQNVWTEYKAECLRVYRLPAMQAESAAQDKPVFERAVDVIIASSALPYYKRSPVLQKLKEQIAKNERQETDMSRRLLEVIPDAMELLALERTQIEMIYLGISIALGHERGTYTGKPPLVPLTGEEYEIKLITDGIMVTYPGNAKACYVPFR